MTGFADPGRGDGGELGAEARTLLDAAREGLSPDAAAMRRVHARIHAATTGAAAGSALAVKLGVIGLVAAVAVSAVIYAGRGSGGSRGPAASAATPAPPAAAATTGPDRAVPPPVERSAGASGHIAAPTAHRVPDEDLITIESPRPAAAPAPATRSASASRTAPATKSPPGHIGTGTGSGTGIALGREVELVDQAMAALRRGDADGALRVAREYAAEAAGGGQLVQDIAAIEIEAMCQLRDPAARDRLAAFDARFPHSAERARIAAACK